MPPITIIGQLNQLEIERIICLICGETVDEKPIETDKAVCKTCIENVFERPSERWINDIKSKIEFKEYEEKWREKLGLEEEQEPKPRRRWNREWNREYR